MEVDSVEDRRIAIVHLEVLRQDARDETKRRIEQRDKYSIQLTIALAAIVAVSVSRLGFGKVLVVAPLVSIYFTVLILYSYRVHNVLASYLREKIEPELARRCGTPPEMEWETFYRTQAVPGIRRGFFLVGLWGLTIGSLLYLWFTESAQPEFALVLVVISVVYILSIAAITALFWKKQK